MFYEPMPLYPSLRPGCERDTCVKVPVFDKDCGGPPRPVLECRRVTIENPCRPGEFAEITLGVDACGSLVVCVRREPHGACGGPPRCRPCGDPCRPHDPCRPPEPRRGCECGRLYGTWK